MHHSAALRSLQTALTGVFAVGVLLLGGPREAQAAATPLARRLSPPVATPLDLGRETRETIKQAPHSALDAETALLAANTIAAQIPGARVFTVLPTGSMRPMFDEKAYVVVEPAPFADLRVGDIVTYEHPKLQTLIVHRILEKQSGGYWTKGDYNERPDDAYVTSANYRMRVFAIIYAKEDGNGGRPRLSARTPTLTR